LVLTQWLLNFEISTSDQKKNNHYPDTYKQRHYGNTTETNRKVHFPCPQTQGRKTLGRESSPCQEEWTGSYRDVGVIVKGNRSARYVMSSLSFLREGSLLLDQAMMYVQHCLTSTTQLTLSLLIS
jgi:hypothetical protein